MALRRHFLALAVGVPMLLAGCGWEPLYANHDSEAANAELRAIRVNPIGDRVGQRLEFALRNALNPSGEPAKQIYTLQVTLSTSFYSLGIQSQGLGTRGGINTYATYRLTEITTGKQLLVYSYHTTDSFDIQANGYSTVVAQDDGYNRCIEDTRREIVLRLTQFLEDRKTTAAAS
jgi:LPS-assembly lipoprotein